MTLGSKSANDRTKWLPYNVSNLYTSPRIPLDFGGALHAEINRYAPVNIDALLDWAYMIHHTDYKRSLEELIMGSESIIIILQFEGSWEWVLKLPWK